MSTATNLDADAFIRKYLEHPSDATARLVFADWLEETGVPHNRAWAYFIRLRIEADLYPSGSAERQELESQADEYALKIRARLTIPAELFVGYPKSLLQFLPAPNITVRLEEYTVPRAVVEYMPESVARENLLLPLAIQTRVFLLATADPYDTDLAQKLEFIINRDIVLVGAEPDDIRNALDRHYDATEVVGVVSSPRVAEWDDTAGEFVPVDHDPDPAPETEPVVRLVNLLFVDAIERRAEAIRITPEPDSVLVSHRSGGAWIERDRLPLRLLWPVTERLATMAWLYVTRQQPNFWHRGTFRLHAHGVRLHVETVMRSTANDGPTTDLTLQREPPVTLTDQ
jgi:uncharacterized protein (TIGR02996 family)